MSFDYLIFIFMLSKMKFLIFCSRFYCDNNIFIFSFILKYLRSRVECKVRNLWPESDLWLWLWLIFLICFGGPILDWVALENNQSHNRQCQEVHIFPRIKFKDITLARHAVDCFILTARNLLSLHIFLKNKHHCNLEG